MIVKVSQSVEVSDEQRAAIGQLHGKKQASRDECRDFIWKNGEDWALLLIRSEEFQAEEEEEEEEEEEASAPPALAAVPDQPDQPELEDLI